MIFAENSCARKCSREFKPVCGSDNKTYNNQCLLEVAKCRTRSNLQVSGEGPCEKAGTAGQSLASGGSNTDEKVEIIEARQEDQGKKPREHFLLIRNTWCSSSRLVCAMRCHWTTSYLVLLLSLYFNGPPPDETFRFHRLLQSVESVELPIDYFSPSILERQQSSRLLYHQSRRRLVVIIVVGGSATNLPTSVFANRNFKVANGDLF